MNNWLSRVSRLHNDGDRPKIATISGSMRFFEQMLVEADALSRDGVMVLMPFIHVPQAEQATSPLKDALDHLHYRKIDVSDFVRVVCPGRYIGASTAQEIKHARWRGISIEFTEAPHGGVICGETILAPATPVISCL